MELRQIGVLSQRRAETRDDLSAHSLDVVQIEHLQVRIVARQLLNALLQTCTTTTMNIFTMLQE